MIKTSNTDNAEHLLEKSWKYQQRIKQLGDLKVFVMARHGEGMSHKQIAAILTITEPTLRAWLKELGVKLKRPKEIKPRKNNTQQQAYDLRETGLTYAKIAEQMGITRMRAWQKVKAWKDRIQ